VRRLPGKYLFVALWVLASATTLWLLLTFREYQPSAPPTSGGVTEAAQAAATVSETSFQVIPSLSQLPGERVWYAALIGFVVAFFATWFGLNRRSGLGALVTRGVPDVPAEVIGFFRLLFAAALFAAFVAWRPVMDFGPVEVNRRLAFAWVDWLLARPTVVGRLEDAILVLLVLFGVGLFTRVVYGLFAVAMTMWLGVLVQLGTNIHVWELPYLTVLCLLPVPWADAFSLDETVRRWRGLRPRMGLHGKRYGFAVWIPGFIMGAVWVSAAYTKLEVSGLDWITGGAVRYHWVADSVVAPVSWGLWVATHPRVAVAMSMVGVVFEATFIAAAFVRTSRARCAVAFSIGLALLLGFFVFHGVLWWTWWLAFLSFALPWQAIYDSIATRIPAHTYAFDLSDASGRRVARFWSGLDWFNRLRFIDVSEAAEGTAAAVPSAAALMRSVPLLWPVRALRSATRGGRNTVGPTEPGVPSFATAVQASPVESSAGLRPVHALLVCSVCLLMITELPEGIGRFTSYAMTYASPEDFDARTPMKWVDRVWIGYDTTAPQLMATNDAALLETLILGLSTNPTLSAGDTARLRELGDRLVRTYGRVHVTLVHERDAFDWEHARFVPGDREVLGTLDIGAMTLVSPGRQ